MNEATELATLGGGCFWCLEAVFQNVKGIAKLQSGFSGGALPNPSYQEICTGESGHAEVVHITFDPHEISYRKLLTLFFTFHDPTTLNRQGADVGTQYRSVIFTHNDTQAQTARAVIAELESAQLWPNPIITLVEPFETFYIAEPYHQNYYLLNKTQPYCQFVISPKVAKLRQHYGSWLRTDTIPNF